ncbi:TM2 domain-containing protein [Streptomyces sulphureus]|uniref:TM2 domain-containing protein n=1 Tax=Streptomyces sulphureus TaxID=47758 RepID=UPI000375CD06|nr:TM2 domain-containing protein [Streptomyces sulphureus]
MSFNNPYGPGPQGQNPYTQPPQDTPPPGYGYPPPGGGYAPPPHGYQPDAPYGYDPYGRPYSDKSKIVAGVLQLFLGTFGIGRFYIGSVGIGVAQIFTCGGLGLWSLIDGILLLISDDKTDSNGRVLRG